MTIEAAWDALRPSVTRSQRRVDETHPCDLYADFDPPDQVGLLAVCRRKPVDARPLRALTVACGERSDGRWSLRLGLTEPSLQPVFAALCNDIVASTRSGVSPDELGNAVVARIQRWRALLDRDASGWSSEELIGLIGELAVLETRLLAHLPLREAIDAWRGPHGAPQDFMLPTGEVVEVKAAERDATVVRINGLGQLDPGATPLALAVVRMTRVGAQATGAVTAASMIARVRARLVPDADAIRLFDQALAALKWYAHPAHEEVACHLLHVDVYRVAGALGESTSFPTLTASSVPRGVVEATYGVSLPPEPDEIWSTER